LCGGSARLMGGFTAIDLDGQTTVRPARTWTDGQQQAARVAVALSAARSYIQRIVAETAALGWLNE
jgi:hypothetical protein